MTDLLPRVFSFSEKCALHTSLGWGSANGTEWSGSSAFQSKGLMEICCIFTYLPYRSCDQDRTAACLLVSLSHTDAFPNRWRGHPVSSFLPIPPAFSEFRALVSGFLHLLPGLPASLLQLWDGFLSMHSWALADPDNPKEILLCLLIFILQSLGWDRGSRVCQATALLPSHIPDSHLLILAPRSVKFLQLQCLLLQEALLVCFPGIPILTFFFPLYIFRLVSCEVIPREARSSSCT